MGKTFTAIALQDEPLDALCWRVMGQTEGVVEQALELNRGLADQGALLTEGQIILLPVLPESFTPQRDIIRLWD